MTAGPTVWLVIAAVSAALFFGIAAVVSIYGIRDLRRLLGGTGRAVERTDRRQE